MKNMGSNLENLTIQLGLKGLKMESLIFSIFQSKYLFQKQPFYYNVFTVDAAANSQTQSSSPL